MASGKPAQAKNSPSINPTIQWVALVVIAGLAVLAAFVFFGEDSTGGGGHNGLAPLSSSVHN
ncbi:MAG: hypothetical protein GY724_20280 [Actinomycetia bacterium]|nr:hypothetical protein [Actinomycetes bacterium]MCP4226691.1 hypothetical protein [Actinomycetes bacterium]MCP5032769.1 hypothetical protein [Actinomycetes bacterium]